MRVVVVDPSRTVLKFVARMLEAGGHEACPFIDAQAALAHLQADATVGALITTAELLSMAGVELCWKARLAVGRRPLYIIMMSSNQERHNLVEALDGGADDFINKPPIPEELYARLRVAARLSSMQHDLIRLATTDPLTGLLNRRAFFEQSQQPCARAEAGEAMCALMLDIDNFKRINDRFGHHAGDDCIRSVAQAVSAVEAIAARMGGEEFAVLLPGRERGAAIAVAENLRETVAALEVSSRDGPLTLTCSIGVSEWAAGDTIDGMLSRADVALYSAKAGGRNRIEVDDTSRVPQEGESNSSEREDAPRDELAVVYDKLVRAIGA